MPGCKYAIITPSVKDYELWTVVSVTKDERQLTVLLLVYFVAIDFYRVN